MASPVHEIDALAAVVVERVGAANHDIATVVSQSWPSDRIHDHVVALAGYSARCVRLADGLHRRFADAATTLTVLGPTTDRLAAIRMHVARAEAAVHGWTSLQAPLDLTSESSAPAAQT